MNKKTYKNYLDYLEVLDAKIKSSEKFSPYEIAKEIGVSTFLPTALRKLNFIVKRETTSGYRYVWNLRNITREQIIDAVIEARARYDKQKKEIKVEEILEKTINEITPEELKAWENKYKTQKAEVSETPIIKINAEEKRIKIITLEESKDVYDSSTAGDVDYNKYASVEVIKKPSILKTILKHKIAYALNWIGKKIIRTIFKSKK